MFVGSTITLENAAGTDVEMVQETDYPWNGKVAITVNPKAREDLQPAPARAQPHISKLYKPTPEVSGIVSLAVNGAPVKPVIENGYAVITRNWKAGDKIELELPLKVQRVKADRGSNRHAAKWRCATAR